MEKQISNTQAGNASPTQSLAPQAEIKTTPPSQPSPAVTPTPTSTPSPLSPLRSMIQPHIPEPRPGTLWKIEPQPKEWEIVYDGFGFVSFGHSRGIILEPAAVENPGDTQAALVIANKISQKPVRNFTLSVQVSTEAQLRKVNPNPWEVFWLFFNYAYNPDGTKETNYFVFKPTGIELGIAYGKTGQRFLATSPTPTLSFGKINTISVTKIDKVVHVFIDGNYVMTYQANKSKDDLLDLPGTIGLYTEDARVHIHSVTIQSLDKT